MVVLKENEQPRPSSSSSRRSHSPQVSVSKAHSSTGHDRHRRSSSSVVPTTPHDSTDTRLGSSHTKVFVNYPPSNPYSKPKVPSPPASDQPRVRVSPANDMTGVEDYRGPVAVANSPPSSVPDLVEASGNANNYRSGWEEPPPLFSWGDDQPTWNATPSSSTRLHGDYSGWGAPCAWYNAEAHGLKPGPGYLPPAMASNIHGLSLTKEHGIARIVISPPSFPNSESRAGAATGSVSPPPSQHPPSRTQVLRAIPHPHALFCDRHNCWIYWEYRTTLHTPPGMIVREYVEPSEVDDLPADQRKRRRVPTSQERGQRINCLEDHSALAPDEKFRIHHFHHYPQSVKGSSLDPPFTRSLDIDATGPPKNDEDEVWLDVWMCCQCQVHIICSGLTKLGVVPGLVKIDTMQAFLQSRFEEPMVGHSGEESVLFALETLIRVVENYAFALNRGQVKVGKPLQNKIGWSETIKQLFAELGFEHSAYSETVFPGQDPAAHQTLGKLAVPGEANALTVQRILRGWVELSAKCVMWRNQHERLLGGFGSNHQLWVTTQYVKTGILKRIGAIGDHIPIIHSALLDGIGDLRPWRDLGMVVNNHTPDLVQYAYEHQIHCDPLGTPQYLSAVHDILRWAHKVQHQSTITVLETVLQSERSNEKWTVYELETALGVLELVRPVRPDQLVDAWQRKYWRIKSEELELERQGSLSYDRQSQISLAIRELKEAYRIVAESTCKSEVLRAYRQATQTAAPSTLAPPEYLPATEMNLDMALKTLEIAMDWDDETIVTVYGLRVQDQPLEETRMKKALAVIARARESERLKYLAENGVDAGPTTQQDNPAKVDWPRGLIQLGNTCYLNSLLQYLYTIKDLRAAIQQAIELPAANATNDEELKKRRVGGRLVTKREVERSQKFVGLLRELFWQMEWSSDPAIRPELDLAKLALVTSKDEEEDEEGRSDGTNATTSTGATAETHGSSQSGSTLVDGQERGQPAAATPLSTALPQSPPASSPSPTVLGKRPAVSSPLERQRLSSLTDIDERKEAGAPSTSDVNAKKGDEDGDVLMNESQAVAGPSAGTTVDEKPNVPPLPPRKRTTVADTGVMMFGRQHDVSECMDNCIFQIEAALGSVKSVPGPDEMSKASPSELTSSLVKRLFYGRIRQRITPRSESADRSPTVHEKEDLFSQLLVNVADEGYDLYDGLSEQFDDFVEFDGKQARMETVLLELPPLLQIQLQRVQFNRETMEAFKSNAYVKFEDSLYLDRFLDTANPERRAQSKTIESALKACRERLTILAKDKGGQFDSAISNTIALLQASVDPTDDMITDLKREHEIVDAELKQCRARATELKNELELLWQEDHTQEYELCSVFIHRGASPSFGHYFFYSRDLPANPDRWIKYNDQDVSYATKEEVLSDTTGSTANPYLLVFARKGSDVIQSINRYDVSQFGDMEMDIS